MLQISNKPLNRTNRPLMVRLNKHKVLAFLVGLTLLTSLLAGCSGSITGDQNNAPAISSSPSQSNQNGDQNKTKLPPTTQSKLTVSPAVVGSSDGKHKGPATIYPNPELTPGDVFPGVTAAQVCVSGYSSSVRSVSAQEKAAVYQSYGIPNEPGQHEVDHFISLELGGSNNLKNLWPEPYEPRPGAHEKDTVENALHAEVCANRMSLPQAQKIIVDDWYAYYLQIKHA